MSAACEAWTSSKLGPWGLCCVKFVQTPFNESSLYGGESWEEGTLQKKELFRSSSNQTRTPLRILEALALFGSAFMAGRQEEKSRV